MTSPALILRDLTLAHGRRIVAGPISGVFRPGSLTAVVGPNGAGKTTLLRALAGLHPPARGRIERGGLPPGRIALLPQASTLDRTFPITCRDVVALGHWDRIGPFGRAGAPQLEAARHALESVGLGGFGARPVNELSAGQFQRLLFARLIVQDAPVLLLDEPFNAIDERTTADLLGAVRAWHAQGRTVIAVLHDLDLVAEAFSETLLLAREPIAWGPTAQVLSAANRRRARLAAAGWTDMPEPERDAA
jgi:zinc/manganese transport system ATP-binding protein